MPDSDAPPHTRACLKREGRRATFLIQPPHQPPRTLKRWPLTPALALKLALGIAQPQRLIRGAGHLARAGVLTAQPTSPWRIVRAKRGWDVEIELEHHLGKHALKWLKCDTIPPAQRLPTARCLGRIVARLAQAGILHRDFKPSNIIIHHDGQDPVIALIDTVAVKTRVAPAVAAADMLAHLAFIPPSFMPFLTPDVIAAVLRSALRALPSDCHREVLTRLRRARRSVGRCA